MLRITITYKGQDILFGGQGANQPKLPDFSTTRGTESSGWPLPSDPDSDLNDLHWVQDILVDMANYCAWVGKTEAEIALRRAELTIRTSIKKPARD